MKKSLLALAVLGAFAGVAQAQSSVTIYGSIDSGVRYKNNVNAAGDSLWALNSGLYNSNRLGFKGVEDLGGGMNAHFNLEAGFSGKTGGQTTAGYLFDRAAFVGLGGTWGSLDLGYQYSVAFKTIGMYEPFNYRFPTIIPLAGAAAGNQGALGTQPYALSSVAGSTRFNNDISYTGKFGGVSVMAEYALGEQSGNTSNGAAQAVGLGYTGGPFSVGAAYTRRKPNLGTAALPNFRDNDQWTVGGAFATGPFRVATGYIDEKQNLTAGNSKTRNAWLGGSFNFTPAAALTAAYYETRLSSTGFDSRRKLFIVGATYALSKRTNFYADVDTARFSGGTYAGNGAVYAQPAGQNRQTGVSVGVSHLF